MFGMEKKSNKPFEFDLEIELRKDSKKKEKLLSEIDAKETQLKGALREGQASENFDQCGLLLQGYAAAKKVLEKASRS